MTILKLIDAVTNGSKIVVSETGTEVLYQPGLLTGGSVTMDCGTERCLSYFLELLVCLGPFSRKSLKVTLTGITNNQTEISAEALKLSWIPQMKRFILNDEGLDLKIVKRGLPPHGGGEVTFSCPAVRQLRPIQLTKEGKIKKIRGMAFASKVSPTMTTRMIEAAKTLLTPLLSNVFVTADHRKGASGGNSPGFGLSLTAETIEGNVFLGEAVSRPAGDTSDPVTPEDIGKRAAENLLNEIYRGGCVDSKAQALTCLYMVLGQKDVSKLVEKMSFDQLHEWLSEVQGISEKDLKGNDISPLGPMPPLALKDRRLDPSSPVSPSKKLISNASRENTLLVNAVIDFVTEKHRNEEDFQEICGQLITLYNRGGILRIFSLQFIPSFVFTYVHLVAQREKKFFAEFETFFLSIYSQEIMELPTTNRMTDDLFMKSEKVVIPNLSDPSIYHHPTNIAQSILTDSSLNRLTAPSSSFPVSSPSGDDQQNTTVQIGPFPAYLNINCENRWLVLTRLLKSVNAHLAEMHPTIVPKSCCRLASAVCRSGFHFPESDVPTRVLGSDRSSGPRDIFQSMDDYSNKPRILCNPDFLLELLNGVYYGLFNGIPGPSLRALDDIRQRASFEMFPDVILVTNAIINSLLENPSGAPKEGPMGIRVAPSNFSISRSSFGESQHSISSEGSRVLHKGSVVQESGSPHLKRQVITNASLRIKRMPEDIPVRAPVDESSQNHPAIKKRLVQPFKDVAASAKRLSAGMDLAGSVGTPPSSVSGGNKRHGEVQETKLRSSSDGATSMIKPSKSDVSIEQSYMHSSEKKQQHQKRPAGLRLKKAKRLPHDASLPEDEGEEDLEDTSALSSGYPFNQETAEGIELKDIRTDILGHKSALAGTSCSLPNQAVVPATSSRTSLPTDSNSDINLAEELSRKLEISVQAKNGNDTTDSNSIVVPPLIISAEQPSGNSVGSSGGYLTPRDSPPPEFMGESSPNATPTANEKRNLKGIKGEMGGLVRNGPLEGFISADSSGRSGTDAESLRYVDSTDTVSDEG